MKRLLILTGIVLLAIASCARDEIKTVNKGHAIDFKVVQTKGDVVNYAYEMESFYVTAFNVTTENETPSATPFFTDVYFGKAGDYFTSNPIYYWPVDGSQLLFFAYTPGTDKTGASVTINTEKMEIADFSPKENINDQVDLMTALGSGSKAENEANGVEMKFEHELSRINILAYENNSEYDYSVTGVRLVNFASKGTLNLQKIPNEWILSDEKTTYMLEYADTPIRLSDSNTSMMYNGDDNSESNDALVLPQTLTPWDPSTDKANSDGGAYISIKLQIKATASGTQIFPATEGEYDWVDVPVPADLTLEEGNVYRFYLNFTNGAGYADGEKILGKDIMFTVAVNGIEEPSAGAIARKELEGHWLAKKVDIEWVYAEGYDGSLYSGRTIEEAEEVKEWFDNNGFYEFEVDNDYNITITTTDGYEIPASFTVDDERYIHIDVENDEDTKIKIHEINNVDNTCIILVEDYNWNGPKVTRHAYITYDRR